MPSRNASSGLIHQLYASLVLFKILQISRRTYSPGLNPKSPLLLARMGLRLTTCSFNHLTIIFSLLVSSGRQMP